MRFHQPYFTLLTLLISAFIGNAAIANQYYMFKDRRGLVLIQDSIPAEFAKYGYKIVNEQGIVIEIVQSEKLQRKKLMLQQKKHNQAVLVAKERAEKKELDERLLQIFSSADEIRVTGNKKILVIQTEIDTTIKHIKAFERNLNTLENQMAESGKGLTTDVKNLRISIAQNNAFILRKRDDQNLIREEYLNYIKRYQVLTIRQ